MADLVILSICSSSVSVAYMLLRLGNVT